MDNKIQIAVIANSRLTALARACCLAEEKWGISIRIVLFSTLPLDEISLPSKYIKLFYRLAINPSDDDYLNIANLPEFLASKFCLLFFTRLVPKCIFCSVKTVNFHPTLLPEFPGLDGFKKAIHASQLAMTAHLVDASMDGGYILGQLNVYPFPADLGDTELLNQSSLLCTTAILFTIKERRYLGFHSKFLLTAVSAQAALEGVLKVGAEL